MKNNCKKEKDDKHYRVDCKEIKEIYSFIESSDDVIKDLNKLKSKSDDSSFISRLEKEYFELCEQNRHYSNTRWNVTMFFIMASFGFTTFILNSIISNNSEAHYELFLILGPIIYFFALLIYWRQKELTYSIRSYLEDFLGPILGLYSKIYIKNCLHNPNILANRFRTSRLLWYGLFVYFIITIILIGFIFFCVKATSNGAY